MKLINALGGRKAVALWASLLVVLVLLCLGRWILPPDLERARMIVQEALSFLSISILAFVGGNAIEHGTKALTAIRALLNGPKPEPKPDDPKP